MSTLSRTTMSAVLVLTLLGACSSGIEEPTASSPPGESGEQPGDAADGTDQGPVPVESASELTIAYFSAGASNAYLQAAIASAEETAEAMGAELDVFDGQFDPQVQYDQMQSALTSGRYNAFAVEPNDGNLVCNLLTEDAPEAGVVVSVFNLPICGRATNLGEETWEPGTVTYVGGQTLDVYEQWVAQVVEENPDGAEVALISGPDLNANSINFFQAAEAFEEAEGFEVVAQQTTDYTTPQAFNAAQTMLQSNPDLGVIMSNFSGMTRGVVQAVADRDVKIYDFGGEQWSLDSVASGDIQSTVMMLPRQETILAIEALGDYVEGEDVPVFINLTEHESLPGTPFATEENLNEFTAEY